MAEQFQNLTGFDELRRKMLAMPAKIAKRVAIPSTGAAAAVVCDEAIKLAPEYHGEVAKGHPPPGTLKRSIFSIPIKRKWSATYILFIVKVRAGEKSVQVGRASTQRAFDPTTGRRSSSMVRYRVSDAKTVGGAYYWWWVEFGTAKLDGRHFMRDAAWNTFGRAVEVYTSVATQKMQLVERELEMKVKIT